MVPVAAVVNETNFRVEAFEFGIRKAELDSGEDAVAVGPNCLG